MKLLENVLRTCSSLAICHESSIETWKHSIKQWSADCVVDLQMPIEVAIINWRIFTVHVRLRSKMKGLNMRLCIRPWLQIYLLCASRHSSWWWGLEEREEKKRDKEKGVSRKAGMISCFHSCQSPLSPPATLLLHQSLPNPTKGCLITG